MQAASFWTFLCKRSCSMPAASLTKVDTTSQSWLVLPKTQGITGYRCVCLSRAAQLQSRGLAVSLFSLSQACCLHRRHSCATSAFCAIEAVHRKVCWLTCYVRKDRRLNTDLRFALASKLDLLLVRPLLMGPSVNRHYFDAKPCTKLVTIQPACRLQARVFCQAATTKN